VLAVTSSSETASKSPMGTSPSLSPSSTIST
jgi:hypothetical protein